MTYTPRTAADPVMNLIASRLKVATWQFDLTTDEENVCLEFEHDPALPKRLITLMRDYKTWVIRVGIAGANRAVGYYSNAKSGHLSPAFRYADMVNMYFWKYKLRDAYEPADGDLNISAERAKNDLIHETEVVQIIKDIEAHLISIGAIVAPTEMTRQLLEKNKGRWAKPTLKGSMADAAEVLRVSLARMTEGLAALKEETRARFDRLEQLIQNQSGCLHGAPI